LSLNSVITAFFIAFVYSLKETIFSLGEGVLLGDIRRLVIGLLSFSLGEGVPLGRVISLLFLSLSNKVFSLPLIKEVID
jgi:hypothetical protein